MAKQRGRPKLYPDQTKPRQIKVSDADRALADTLAAEHKVQVSEIYSVALQELAKRKRIAIPSIP